MQQRVEQYQQDQPDLVEYIIALKRWKGRALLVALLVAGIGLGVAFGLPAIYKSKGTILIEQQEIPKELVQSTITTFADQRLQVIKQRVMTTTNLMSLIERYNLYTDERKEEPIEIVLQQMRDEDIQLEPLQVDIVDSRTGRATTATIAFTVSYSSKSPDLAQKVANELVTLYMNENLKSRTEMAEETSVFLAEEAENLKREISTLEEQLAKFKEENVYNLPELRELNLSLMDKSERTIQDLESQIRMLDERVIYLESELSQLSPYSTSFTDTGQRILAPEDRLKSLESQYVQLVASYSEEHPDVVRMKKEIDALMVEVGASSGVKELRQLLQDKRGELAATREKYSDQHPDVKRLEGLVKRLEDQLATAEAAPRGSVKLASDPDNPAYVQLKARLVAAREERKSLEERLAAQKDKVTDYESRLTAAPQVERQYRALTRDHDTAAQKYAELKAKLTQAKMAESLEAERKGERFTLIEPPLLPEEPVSPNRMAISLFGFILALGMGIGTVALSEALDSTVHGGKGVAKILRAPPLAVIPYIETTRDRRRKRVLRMLLIGVLVAAGLIVLALIHVFVMPLDVIWFKLLNKAV